MQEQNHRFHRKRFEHGNVKGGKSFCREAFRREKNLFVRNRAPSNKDLELAARMAAATYSIIRGRSLDRMRIFLHIILAVVAVGCTPKPGTRTEGAPPIMSEVVALDEAKASAIARQVVATNGTWVNRATFEAKRDGSGWSVIVWRQPPVFGGHRVVQIDERGRVTASIRGM